MNFSSRLVSSLEKCFLRSDITQFTELKEEKITLICKQLDTIATLFVNGEKIGEVTQKLYDILTGIQWGKTPDGFGWVYKL